MLSTQTKLLNCSKTVILQTTRKFGSISNISNVLFPITLVGSYPQPKGLNIPSWFGNNTCEGGDSLSKYTQWLANQTDEIQTTLNNAFNTVIYEQISFGVDLPTDGELNRENYIFYHCRHLNGFDFVNTQTVSVRGMETVTMEVPVIRDKISVNTLYLAKHWKQMQEMSSKPLKVTIPGPLTIVDTSKNEYYSNTNDLYYDLSIAINEEILSLKQAGIKYIQIDEPLWCRNIENAKNIGFECIEKCFDNINDSDNIYRTIHICRGYMTELDDRNYKKSNIDCYIKLANCGMDSINNLDGISIEDSYQRIPLEYFKLMKNKDFILGCVTSVTSYVHSKDEIFNRVNEIINECSIDPSRIILSSDCGLAMLSSDNIKAKLLSMKNAQNFLRLKYL